MNLRPICIVGGGLAGLTLGVCLRRRGIPTTIWEAGHYPRHRVCGEFISGRGRQVLETLGLHVALVDAGAVLASNAVFFLGDSPLPNRPITPPALGISRYTLDALLARQFQELGGDLRKNSPRRDPCLGEGVVRASGRRAHAARNGTRWFGIKAHARNVQLVADLEMHCSPDRYVGVSRIENGQVNICGLFKGPMAKGPDSHSGRDLLLGPPGSLLHRRLAQGIFDESSFCSVAGLPLQPQRASDREECCIGDALTMIPPVTGNGMSMAFESAATAALTLEAYSRGGLNWQQTRDTIARNCDQLFARRLRWAAWLQRLLFFPCVHSRLGAWAVHSRLLWNLVFANTR